MHRIEWQGAVVSWNPSDDDWTVAVAMAVEPPDLAAWLDANLTAWLRGELADRDYLIADVTHPQPTTNGVPTSQVVIRRLREPLPEPRAIHALVEEAAERAEGMIAQERRGRAAHAAIPGGLTRAKFSRARL